MLTALPASERSPTAVVIDDDPVSLIYLAALLQQEGFSSHRAANGPDGRGLVRARKPDVVLLDVNMPGENGLETCRILKADPATADVPVIFLSGAEDLHTKLDGFKAGAVDFITKPYQAAEVLARIRVHIGSRRMMRLLAATQIAQLESLAKAQKAILPEARDLPRARFASFYRPVHAAGGDFFSVLQAGEDIYDYVVADVSGHDADASLVTSALKVLLHQGNATLSSPADTLRMVNDALRAAFPDHVYLTLAWARLNRNRKTLMTILAGHPPILHLARSGAQACLGEPGDVLGSFGSIDIEEHTCPVAPGDRILMFTDGLIELAPTRALGMERLAAAAQEGGRASLESMVERIAEALILQASEVNDDLLLLGVEA